MPSQVAFRPEGHLAVFAFEASSSNVDVLLVLPQRLATLKVLGAGLAFEGFLGGMFAQMGGQVSGAAERLSARWTFVFELVLLHVVACRVCVCVRNFVLYWGKGVVPSEE